MHTKKLIYGANAMNTPLSSFVMTKHRLHPLIMHLFQLISFRDYSISCSFPKLDILGSHIDLFRLRICSKFGLRFALKLVFLYQFLRHLNRTCFIDGRLFFLFCFPFSIFYFWMRTLVSSSLLTFLLPELPWLYHELAFFLAAVNRWERI